MLLFAHDQLSNGTFNGMVSSNLNTYSNTMTRIIALSPKKNTSKRPYKSKARLAAKEVLLAKKAGKKK
jgi:hypothetical protein